jgi:hypothetical protein
VSAPPSVRLDDASIEAVAQRVAELLRGKPPSRGESVDAAWVASRLGVRRDWVYRNKYRLGALPLGDGPKPRLLFDRAEVERSIRGAEQETDALLRPVPRRRTRSEASDLLPIKGKQQ